ncbi:hypothetical protein ABIE13_000149 [Ottowia thiooxydans]|uniref:Uncharacterized protein n=1 Tax=Ottowia thiooxydans TaxID=219182 RepID=A0ABV2Q371_9BURK
MRYAAINDVHGIDPAFGGIQGASNLGQHATTDSAVCDQIVNAGRRKFRQKLTLLIQHARNVSEHPQSPRHLSAV